MKISITHTRDPLMNWDVSVSVDAEAGEKIANVNVDINHLSAAREPQAPPVDSWEKDFPRVGQYPGDNVMEVVVLDQTGNETRKKKQWS